MSRTSSAEAATAAPPGQRCLATACRRRAERFFANLQRAAVQKGGCDQDVSRAPMASLGNASADDLGAARSSGGA